MCAAAKAAKIALKLYFDAAALVIAGLSGTAEHRSYRCRSASASAEQQHIGFGSDMPGR